MLASRNSKTKLVLMVLEMSLFTEGGIIDVSFDFPPVFSLVLC